MKYKQTIYCLQHILESSNWLIDRVEAAFPDYEVEVKGKPYSTIPSYFGANRRFEDVESWNTWPFRRPFDVSLILDEGGRLHDTLPLASEHHVAGLEQTSSGMRRLWRYPVVLVCRSAAKIVFESQIIARGIVRKLESLQLLDGRPIGVVGLGAIGGEVARLLASRSGKIIAIDQRKISNGVVPLAPTIAELVGKSELIIGCTGTDIFDGINLSLMQGRKVFVSCSSSDIEFRSLLMHMTFNGPYESAQGVIGSSNCTVLNGGFPINFDREREWEQFDEIILTRRLCLEGLIQSRSLLGSAPRGVMLDPATQLRLTTEWLERVPDRDTLYIPPRLDEQFFRDNSEGDYLMTGKPNYTLHSTTPGAVAQMREHQEPYDTDVAGLPIIVLPSVWSPAYDWSSVFYVENFPDVTDKSFLEIGCGTGVISVFAARRGANRVVAVDVNPEAVRNAALNFEKFRIANAEAFLSDGFGSIRGEFDFITWNAPYHGSRPADLLERGCADEGYRDIRAFFRDVGKFLKPEGTVVFGFSESGDLPLIETLILEANFHVKRRLSDWRQSYNCILFELVIASEVGD
ncbi:methyltransferase [Parasphingorhabdus sp.]|uniref:methyltransferase n=1 Tax=Parasphingorhabdus sp. TaxID=2709688 RepID=UPI002B26D991|nr:methyltransferase [Parasphingorhabdus sp.]